MSEIAYSRGTFEKAPDKRTDGVPAIGRWLLILILVPATFYAGPLLLTPSRLLLLFATPVLLVKLLQGEYGRVRMPDIAMIAFALWRVLALAMTMPDRVVQYSGSTTVIILGAYLCGRATIRTPEHFAWMSKFLILSVLAMLPLAIFESITGGFIIPKLINALPGISSVTDVNYERRFGLDRAQVVFDHPILFGLYCTLPLSLGYIGLRQRVTLVGRILVAGLILAAVFFSVSSGAFLAAMFQIGLIAYGIVTQRIRTRWIILLSVLFVIYVVAEYISSRPALFVLVEKIAFDAWNANYRKLIFEYGVQQVQMTPVFGVGIGEWAHADWMTNSIDNYWLGMAIQFGLPALFFLGVAVVSAIWLAARRRFDPEEEVSDQRLAWIFTFISISLTLATVFIWSDASSAIYFVFGAGIWMLNWPGLPPEPTGRQDRNLPASRFGGQVR
ncbi:MAG: O-antigen ligase family protein [Deltaproteobacteria bacterium]